VDEKMKGRLQIVALVIAAALGFGVALFSVNELNKATFSTMRNLALLDANIQLLDNQRKELEEELGKAKERLTIINNGDVKSASALLQVVQSNKDALSLITSVGSLTEDVASLKTKQLLCVAMPTEDHQGFALCAEGYYSLAQWCSGDCNGDDARVVICCKP
jgi:hypothetical protein